VLEPVKLVAPLAVPEARLRRQERQQRREERQLQLSSGGGRVATHLAPCRLGNVDGQRSDEADDQPLRERRQLGRRGLAGRGGAVGRWAEQQQQTRE